MILPIVTRELQVRSRAATTIYFRAGAAAAVMLVIGILLWRTSGAAVAGQIVLNLIGWLLFGYASLEGLRNAAVTVSTERQEGTLGLLFLTDLASLDVVLGKLVVAGLGSVYALMSIIPVLFVAVLAGGVTAGELLHLSAALLGTLMLSLAAGIWASVRYRDPLHSMVAAFVLFLTLCFGPILGEVLYHAVAPPAFPGKVGFLGLLSPVGLLTAALQYTAIPGDRSFWWGILAQIVMAIGLVGLGAWRLAGCWRSDDSTPRLKAVAEVPTTRGLNDAAVLRRSLQRQLGLNPWGWVMIGTATLGELLTVAPFLLRGNLASGSAVALVGMSAPMLGVGGWFLMVYLLTRFFCEGRQRGEFELLLTSGLNEVHLVKAVWHGFRPWWLAYWLVGLLGELAAWLVATQTLSATTNLPLMLTIWVPKFLYSTAYLYASAWAAMWFGASSTTLAKALGKLLVIFGGTSFLGIMVLYQLADRFLPPIVLRVGSGATTTCSAGVFVPLGVFVGWAWWARRQMLTQFHSTVAGNPPPKSPRPDLRRILWGPAPAVEEST